MKFFHVYNERNFEGLIKNGLINEDSAFKMQNVFSVPRKLQFNSLAAKGSRLHTLIKENRYPFYVDRIAGGITYFKYDYDPALIEEYENLLGNWFLGFQLHESASNRRNDWKSILSRMEGATGPYDLEALRARSWRHSSVTPDGRVLQGFSQGTPETYAEMRLAESSAEFHKEIEEMFALRMRETNGHILPCDSYYLYTHLQNKLGMNTFMPEIGCQIPDTRIALALARGMARANHKTWGSYYECWIHNPEEGYSMPCYNTTEFNEWYLTQQTHGDDFTTRGENGGSSRLLQKRLYYHSLMSGADYFAEEWGLNCSYSDMNTFELSPYGLVKKEFIDASRTLRGIKLMTPFAIVLPTAFSCVQIGAFTPIGEHRSTYMEIPLGEEERAYNGHIEDVLKLIYMRAVPAYGNESHVLTNSRFGDLFDIVYEDASDEALSGYEYLIDPTEDGQVAHRLGKRHRVLESRALDWLETRLRALEHDLMPVTVDALCWLVSTDERGKRYLSIFNNEGNERTHAYGDTVRHEADATVTVTLREAGELSIVKASSSDIGISRVDAHSFSVEIPATEFVIFAF